MADIARKIESIIHPAFILKLKTPKNKTQQEFRLFIGQPEVKKSILHVRRVCNINYKQINKKIKIFKNIVKKEAKISQKVSIYKKKRGILFDVNPRECLEIERKMGYEKMRNERKVFWEGIKKYLDSRISYSRDIEPILITFDKPSSWDALLTCYVLTNQIKTYLPRNDVHLTDDKIFIELTGDTTFRDLKARFKVVKKLQPFVQGYDLKKKRYKKKLDTHLFIAKDHRKYRNKKRKSKIKYDYSEMKENVIGINELKAGERLYLVDKYNPNAAGEKSQKREAARQRQIYRRNKRYV